MSHTKAVTRKVETYTEIYVILDSLLCKLIIPEKEIASLAFSETCTDNFSIISVLFAVYQGVINTYLIMGDKLLCLRPDTILKVIIKRCALF